MNTLATLHIPDFGLVSARYSGPEELVRGMRCVVERGNDRGIGVLCSSAPIEDGRIPPQTRILRIASATDLEEEARTQAFAREAESVFTTLIAKYQLPTRTIRAHVFLGRTRLILWHCPSAYLPDLHSLEGEFRRKMRCPIELCEANARLVAALLGGCGCCGRALCCAAGRVPAREPTTQEAILAAGTSSPMSIYGLCNRTKCCLAFES